MSFKSTLPSFAIYKMFFSLFFKALHKLQHLWEALLKTGLHMQRMIALSYKSNVYTVLEVMTFIAALVGL